MKLTPTHSLMKKSPTKRILQAWVKNYVKGYVKTESATAEASVTAWFHGAGNAIDVTNESTTCLIDGTTCYDA